MSPAAVLVLGLIAAAPSKLAAPEWSVVNIAPDLASFYAGEVARVLRREGFEVVTAKDISAALGLERQKQLLGCGEENSCMAELGAALGCDGIVTANLARLDDTYRGSLRVLSARDGRTLADEPVEASGQRALSEALERAAERLVRRLRPPPPNPGVRRFSWIPLAGGVLLGAGATASFVIAGDAAARIPNSTEEVAVRLANDGSGAQTAGWILASTGVAALLTAGAMFLFGAPAGVTPQVVFGPSGLSAGFSWVLP